MQYNSNIYILIYLVIGTIVPAVVFVIVDNTRKKDFTHYSENRHTNSFLQLLMIMHIVALVVYALFVPVKYSTSDLVLNIENSEVQLEETGSNDYYMMTIQSNNGNIKKDIDYFISKENAKPLLNTKAERIRQIKCQLIKHYTILDMQKNETELINITIQ